MRHNFARAKANSQPQSTAAHATNRTEGHLPPGKSSPDCARNFSAKSLHATTLHRRGGNLFWVCRFAPDQYSAQIPAESQPLAPDTRSNDDSCVNSTTAPAGRPQAHTDPVSEFSGKTVAHPDRQADSTCRMLQKCQTINPWGGYGSRPRRSFATPTTVNPVHHAETVVLRSVTSHSSRAYTARSPLGTALITTQPISSRTRPNAGTARAIAGFQPSR